MVSYRSLINGLKTFNHNVSLCDGWIDRIKMMATHPLFKKRVDNILELHEQFKREPLIQFRYTDYQIFKSTGSRKEFQDYYFRNQLRLEVASIAYLINESSDNRSHLENVLFQLCTEYLWALQAHIKQVCKDTRYNPQRELDLFSCEMAFTLAEITYLFRGKIDDDLCNFITTEINERIFIPYMLEEKLKWWEVTDMNWAAVCAGSIGAAAIYLISDESALAPILLKVLATLGGYLDGFPEDGACLEGYEYWKYGFSFYVYFADLLKRRTNNHINLFQIEKVKQVATFQQKAFLIDDYILPFSDTDLTSRHLLGLTHYLAKLYQTQVLPPEIMVDRTTDGHYRWVNLVRDFLWYEPNLKVPKFDENDYCFKESQILVSKKRFNDKRIVFAFKGGHNGEPHNHNDIGTFILQVEHDTLISDLGRGEYTKQYFDENLRYNYLTCSSYGHSVPIINGYGQASGRDKCGINFEVNLHDVIRGKLNLTHAYEDPSLLQFIRHFTYQASQPCLIIEDEFLFNKHNNHITERFITVCPVKMISPNSVSIIGKNSTLLIQSDNINSIEIKKEVYKNHRYEEKEAYLIDFHCQVDAQTKLRFNFAWLDVK